MQSSRNSTALNDGEKIAATGVRDRRIDDRRGMPTRPWTSGLTPLRRQHGRRESDRSAYVDSYTRRDAALVVTIFMLNIGDAFFTMRWLARGGKEANPFMDFFLDIGPGAFLAQKCLIVGFWLLILLVHKNFRFARMGLYVSLAVYVVLMLVHFAIVALGIEPPTAEELAEAEAGLEAEHARPNVNEALMFVLAVGEGRLAVRRASQSASE